MVLVAILLALPAAAVEEQHVQGNYTDGKNATAKVVAEGGGNYRVLLNLNGKEITLRGKTSEKGADPTFEGTAQGSFSDGKIVLTRSSAPNRSLTLTRSETPSPTLGAKPPRGAIVLMDGTNLDEWETSPLKWHLRGDGSAEVANPELISKREFGDHKLHIEFRTPFMPSHRGQARGNSGVYLHGVYEVQVLDSFGLPPADNDCGGIYKVAVPTANMCLPPLEWQTYDITFRAARFDNTGKKTENARITVNHNGVTIHDDIELPSITGGAMRDTEHSTGPLKLQHHHDAVRYRNVWAVPLD